MVVTSPLANLTRQQRDTLHVLRECGWLYKAAAKELGIPEATVRTRVYQAVQRAKVGHRTELAYWMGREDEARVVVGGAPMLY